jgi:membrane protein
VLIYLAAITLGPLLLAVSLSTTAWVISASRGMVRAQPGGMGLVFDVIQFLLLVAALSALYRYVPNTPVRAGHAIAGGLFAAIGIEVAKGLLAWYIGNVPTYSMVYGAFATAPILLVWIYIAWLTVLFGAVVAAYLPSLMAGTRRPGGGHGWQFQLAMEVLQNLQRARGTAQRGLSASELADALQVESLQLEPVLQTLVQLDWIGRLNEVDDHEATRFVLLADERSTTLEPLIRQLLLPASEATGKLWDSGRLSSIRLQDVL